MQTGSARVAAIRIWRTGAAIVAALLTGLGFLAPAAQAGDTFVLDYARTDVPPTTEEGIARVAGGAQSRLALTYLGGAADFSDPVGIDVDETDGTLLVTDSGGYAEPYDFGLCEFNGCGALLRVDPGAQTATLIAGPSSPGGNRLSNPYGVIYRPPPLDDALVAETGSGRVIRVDLATGGQSTFNLSSGLRAPWGIAVDPTNGDVLVANTGCVTCDNPFNPAEIPAPPFVVPAECAGVGNRGFVMRFSSAGALKTMYCSPDLLHPRNLVVDGSGAIFVVDPFAYATPAHVADETGFGTVFRIDPASREISPVTAGGSLATVSGIDFNVAGTRLLLADETLSPPAGPCPNGCGGVVQLNADGGAQTVLEQREAGGDWIDPIALAVDRDGAAAPTLTTPTVPEFLHLERDEGGADPIPAGARVPIFPLREGSEVLVYCLGNKECPGKKPRTLVRRFAVPVATSKLLLTLARTGGALANPAKPSCRRCKKEVVVKPRKTPRAAGSALNGRFVDLRITRDPLKPIVVQKTGCLAPGATTPLPRKPKKKGKKPRKSTVACPEG